MNGNSEKATYSPHFALSTTKRRPFEKTKNVQETLFLKPCGVSAGKSR
jgi:hypothetical protein